jgi:molybdate transport system substrate-binding protein
MRKNTAFGFHQEGCSVMFQFMRPLAALLLALSLTPARAEGPAKTPVIAPAAAPAAEAQSTIIFAAASLKNALDEAAASYKEKHGVEAKISYGSSLTLAKQIEAGAPADLFVAADLASMDYLAGKNLIQPATRANFLGNTLVVVAPATSKLSTLAFTKEAFEAALGSGGRIATGDVSSVPVGKYAKAALEKLNLWSALEPRFAFADNVRSALMFVAREETPLGVVYQTDAKSEPRVKVVATFAANTHPPIVYPIALVAGSKNEAAVKFLAFLKSKEGKACFVKQGFALQP